MLRTLCYHCYASVDVNGEVLVTECECPAGMGPNAHCKHIQAVLFAIIGLTGGKQPKLELCCTDVLQSFHRPHRLHTGSPVKASKLKLTKETLTLNCDPRPQKYRKLASYPDYVKNLALNCAASTGDKMPLLQTLKPANMYAVEHDHHYLAKPLSSIFLDKTNITTISMEKADEIEKRTEGQAKVQNGRRRGETEWKEERRNRMEGGDEKQNGRRRGETEWKEERRNRMEGGEEKQNGRRRGETECNLQSLDAS